MNQVKTHFEQSSTNPRKNHLIFTSLGSPRKKGQVIQLNSHAVPRFFNVLPNHWLFWKEKDKDEHN